MEARRAVGDETQVRERTICNDANHEIVELPSLRSENSLWRFRSDDSSGVNFLETLSHEPSVLWHLSNQASGTVVPKADIVAEEAKGFEP